MLVFAVNGGLHADLLTLENGDTVEGLFEKETDDGKVVFRGRDGEARTYDLSEVKELQVGYSGEPVCYETQDGQSDCDGLLHRFSDGRMFIAHGRGHLALRDVPIETIVEVRVENERESDSFGSTLPTDTDMELEVDQSTDGGGEIRGRIVSQTNERIVFEKEDGQRVELARRNVVAAVFRPDEVPTEGFRWTNLYPGIPQIRREDNLLGYSLFGGFNVLLFGVAWEYYQAQQVAAAAGSDLSVLLFYNKSYLEEFEAHQRNQRNFGYLALIVFGYSLLDYYWNGSTPPRGAVSGETADLQWSIDSSWRALDGEHTGKDREIQHSIALQVSF